MSNLVTNKKKLEEFDKKIYNVLQLRYHKAIIDLKLSFITMSLYNFEHIFSNDS